MIATFEQLNEVMDWLIQSHELGIDSLYKDIDSIESSFDSEQMSCLTFENKTVGFATWRLQDRVAFVDLFELKRVFSIYKAIISYQ